MSTKQKVVVGLSGGVDSSVAAYLLKEQGYEVIGVTMQVWEPEEGGEEKLAVTDARKVADALQIPYHVLNFYPEFQSHVMDYFVQEYIRGYTPNPCNACNRFVKWEALLKAAANLGVDYIATGHYAMVRKLVNGRYSICNSVTASKDQTYALYNLTQDQLAHTLMPVGAYEKAQIREMAEQAGIPVADKKDSQDICFIPNGDYADFIRRSTGKDFAPGNFVDVDGRVLGQHKGLVHYTVGQRKGLGITAETPLFVKELRPETNEVVVCKSQDLFTDTCIIREMNYMALPALSEAYQAIGKVRYANAGSECILEPMENGFVKCRFKEKQRAITPGQAAVFYENDYVLCGGTIVRSMD